MIEFVLCILLYFGVSLCLVSVSVYRKNWTGVYLIAFCWTICYVSWYVASPTYRGPISILKSVDRSPIEDKTIRNWGDTKSCKPTHIIKAKNVNDIVSVMGHERIRVAGGGHSWSPLICSNDTVVSLDFCSEPLMVNNIVTVDAGCKIEYVNTYLQQYNRVLHGFGGIQYQTIGGSIMTSLHGSQYVGFSNNILNMSAVLANKTIVSIKDNDLKYWKSSMGMLGIVYSVSMQTFPLVSLNKTCKMTGYVNAINALNQPHFGATLDSFWGMYQDSVQVCTYNDPVEEHLPYEKEGSDSFSFVYDNIVLPCTLLFSNVFRMLDLTKIIHTDSTTRLSILDAWKIVSGYGFVSAEYSVPLDQCLPVIHELQEVTYPRIVAVYIRRLNASNEVLSFAKVDSCVIDLSFADYQLIHTYEEMKEYHSTVEQIIKEHNGSMHWGKYYASNTTKIEIDQSFKDYRTLFDPSNKFMNSYTTELITGVQNNERYGRYDDPAINLTGVFWRSLWWTTFAVASMSSLWYSNGSFTVKQAMRNCKTFYICILIAITVTSLLENWKVDPDIIKGFSFIVYSIGITGFCFLLWLSTPNYENLLPPYAILQLLLLLVWTIDQFNKFHEIDQDDLKKQGIYDGHTHEDVVYYSGILMLIYALICGGILFYLKGLNSLRFWYHWIQFAFLGTFSAFVSLSTHATTSVGGEHDGMRNGHGHLWWLPIIGVLVIAMLVVNYQRSQTYYFHWLHFVINIVLVCIWIGYHFRVIKQYVWDTVLGCTIVLEIAYLNYLSKPMSEYRMLRQDIT